MLAAVYTVGTQLPRGFFPFWTLIMYSLAQNFNWLTTTYRINQILEFWYPKTPTIWLQSTFPLYLLLNTPHWCAPTQTLLHPQLYSLFWSHSALSYVYSLLHLCQKPSSLPVCLPKSCNPSKPHSNSIFFSRRHSQFDHLAFLSLSPILSRYFVYAPFPTPSWWAGTTSYSAISVVLCNTWYSEKKTVELNLLTIPLQVMQY